MIFSFAFADFNTLPAYALMFSFHFKLVLVSTSALMSSAGIMHGKFLKLLFPQ
jgi:hypothetical protein